MYLTLVYIFPSSSCWISFLRNGPWIIDRSLRDLPNFRFFFSSPVGRNHQWQWQWQEARERGRGSWWYEIWYEDNKLVLWLSTCETCFRCVQFVFYYIHFLLGSFAPSLWREILTINVWWFVLEDIGRSLNWLSDNYNWLIMFVLSPRHPSRWLTGLVQVWIFQSRLPEWARRFLFFFFLFFGIIDRGGAVWRRTQKRLWENDERVWLLFLVTTALHHPPSGVR